MSNKPAIRHFRRRNTLCCVSGTMSAMLRMGYILTTQNFKAKSVYIGCVTSVQAVSCTDTKRRLIDALQGDLVGAHSVLAKKCVIATPWQPVSHPSQQSGTSLAMRVRQLISPQGLTKWFGGRTTGVVAGSSGLLNARLLARVRADGRLAHAP